MVNLLECVYHTTPWLSPFSSPFFPLFSVLHAWIAHLTPLWILPVLAWIAHLTPFRILPVLGWNGHSHTKNCNDFGSILQRKAESYPAYCRTKAPCRIVSVMTWYGRFSEILTFCCMTKFLRQKTHSKNKNCYKEVTLYLMDSPWKIFWEKKKLKISTFYLLNLSPALLIFGASWRPNYEL